MAHVSAPLQIQGLAESICILLSCELMTVGQSAKWLQHIGGICGWCHITVRK